MKIPRSSGILLHPTSLPGPNGIGEIGDAAHRFVDFLERAGQKLWQVLPLGPTGYGDSPYQSFSAFAGNPLLIGLDRLSASGYLTADEVRPKFPDAFVDFSAVLKWKLPLLALAAERFYAGDRERNAFEKFEAQHWYWLDDYATFMAGKQPYSESAHRYWQFEFFRQWRDLKRYAAERGVRMMGDMPIYVSGDSADVYAHPGLFRKDFVAGVPPDYFSATGQLWGNFVYNWDAMARDGYNWWTERFRHTLEMVDLLRLDHFRGFEAFWQVPACEHTAVNGEWVRGPGASLFEVLEAKLGPLLLVAENLGVITPEVEAIRERFGFPGMSVLQFAFGSGAQSASFRPHNYVRELVAYTGTHDNDTTLGWWASGTSNDTRGADEIRREHEFAAKYLRTSGGEINWTFIEALMASVADTVIVPLQDVIGLGSEARMNTPATAEGNWKWRFTAAMLTSRHESRLKELAQLYDR
jgi:4-alpha-glucanotransferase